MVTTSSLSFNTEMLEVRSKEDSSLARSLRKDMQGSPFVTRFIERTLVRGLADEGHRGGRGGCTSCSRGRPR